MVKFKKEPSGGVIRNWMSNKNAFEFYSLWEEFNNENFNSVESHRIKIKHRLVYEVFEKEKVIKIF